MWVSSEGGSAGCSREETSGKVGEKLEGSGLPSRSVCGSDGWMTAWTWLG